VQGVAGLNKKVWAWELLALIFIQSGFLALSKFGKVSNRDFLPQIRQGLLSTPPES
jgi:hypothetical protein